MNTGIYPGSFDPVTNGHIDIIERSAKIFDKLVVAVLKNQSKMLLFTTDERINMIRESTTHIPNVEVDCFNGLLVDFAKIKQAKVIVKGLRAVSDFEYELQMALMNKKLANDIETVLIMTNCHYSYLSSSIVKEVVSLKGCVKNLVPPNVAKQLKNKFNI